MIFKHFGDKNKPVIILIHGGELSYWMWKPQIEVFKNKYYIVTPILDGNGECSDRNFESIKDCAAKIIDYVNNNFNGKVLAICGLSLGAQITVEILSQSNNIAEKSIIESAMVIPIKFYEIFMRLFINSTYFFSKRRWFVKLQAKKVCIPKDMFEDYYRDNKKISKKSLINMVINNARYTLPMSFKNNKCKILVVYGEKEYSVIKKSAQLIHKSAYDSNLITIPGCGHGASIKLPNDIINIMRKLFEVDR
ncbi:alpha/beta hydrolase [Clostridium pasteurianum]|uniref:alpha/beta hydrolase family protein n=1 Tax=Clostridium pasteurianum TaxID=1501 RepID=UPI002260B46B|nr:alpha/beta hydrolase [Clostridium pasteurianum]UZW15170.1 alpha/beta hydrolase [Clostridium pasteurianum]